MFVKLPSSIGLRHCGRMNTEEKTKVVAAVWVTEFSQFLAVLAVLHYDDLKKRTNFSRMI